MRKCDDRVRRRAGAAPRPLVRSVFVFRTSYVVLVDTRQSARRGTAPQSVHSRAGRSMFARRSFSIVSRWRAAGAAAAGAAVAAVASAQHGSCSSAEPALSKKEFRSFPVAQVEKLNHNVSRIRVRLPTPDSEIGMVTAGLLMVQGYDAEGNKTKAKPSVKPPCHVHLALAAPLPCLSTGQFVSVKH